MPPKDPEITGPAVRQGHTAGSVQNVQDSGGRLASFWAFRFTGTKVDEQQILKNFDVPWITEYGFQKEKGKKRGMEHFQGSFVVEPRKRFKQLESHFKQMNEELQFDGRDYLQPTKSDAANAYGMKEETRIDGPWWKGERYEELAKELVYKVEITLTPWQKKICDILEQPEDDRAIWWFWEPFGGIGKTTFQKWIYQNYDNVMISGGKSADMKNGVVRFLERNGKHPKIVLINIPKTFKMDYFSPTGVEEVKDMFFFSGKYGSKEEKGEVCGPPPKVLIFANERPPIEDMAKDRWMIRRLPDGRGKEVSELNEELWKS